MPERIARVVALEPDAIGLVAEPEPCTGCDSGCGGRCNLLPIGRDGGFTLPATGLPGGLVAGDRVRVRIEEPALRRAALAGYGLGVAGLVLGALAGAALARLGGLPADPVTLIGMLVGTVLALRCSNRHRVRPRVFRLEARDGRPHLL